MIGPTEANKGSLATARLSKMGWGGGGFRVQEMNSVANASCIVVVGVSPGTWLWQQIGVRVGSCGRVDR